MATYMQQTLCLVTEHFNRGAVADRTALNATWQAAFGRLPFVHFASLAVLPGVAGEGPVGQGDGPPSLALELAIDDGIEPADALSRLVDAAPAELWALYMTDPDPGPIAKRRDELLKTLKPLARHARAAGGFVGMRDRSAAQVRAEQRWFGVARDKLREVRAEVLQASEPPDAGDLVNRLLVKLRAEPGWAAMSSAPPLSWWRRPRPGLLQLLMALVWVVLPLPLFACALALLGWLTEFALRPLPETAGVFAVGGVFAILLLGVVLALGLVLSRTIAVAVALVVSSLAGIVLFYLALVVAYLNNLPQDALVWKPEARGITALLLAALAGLWVLIRTARSETFARGVGLGVAIAGAAVAGFLMGSAWNNSLQPPPLVSRGTLAYVLPWSAAALLIWRSAAARWYFALGLVLILLLLLLLPPAIQGLAALDPVPALAGLEIKIRRHTALGALALADLLLLLGAVACVAALALLRAPRAPLGVPLLVALALLLAGHLVVAGLVLRLLKAADVLPQLGEPQTYLCVLLGLVLTGLFVVVLLLLAGRLLQAIQRSVDEADRPFPGHVFAPLVVNREIVVNEAEQINGANHMISLTDIRGRRWGWHWMMTWLWLHVVGASGMLVYTRGPLGTAQGIQFAHWHLVQQGRRLLFLSNYDGEFSGYLDEFIRGTSQGINLIWRWTKLERRRGVDVARVFPPTRGLAFSGCHNEQAFKAYARASMVPHLMRYRAYPSSCQDIERCTQLRTALAGARTPQNDNLVLRLLGS